MRNCYLCNDALTKDNKSIEHILLNSIGGRLKSDKLLCKKCNSKLGEDADKELAKQLLFLSSYIQVKRDNGKNQIIKGSKTKEGEQYDLVDGLKPVLSKPIFNKKIEGGRIEYQITARNEKDVINILKGLKKKYPELDIEKAKEKFEVTEKRFTEPLSNNMLVGGNLSFRSIVKTAANYYIHIQNDKAQVEHLFKYLKGEEDLLLGRHFYPGQSIYQRDENEIIHLIHLKGDSQAKILYCVIEFFSSYSFVILLSDNYEGNDISSTYCYDLLTNKTIEKVITVELKKEDIVGYYKMSLFELKEIETRLNRVMAIADKIHTTNELKKINRKSIEEVLEKYKHEPVATEKLITELSHQLATNYMNITSRNRKKPPIQD
jgi:hypothetical protein